MANGNNFREKILLKNYSLSASLKSRNKSDEHFENVLKRLSLEEVIALKIELSMKEANSIFLGIPFYSNCAHIMKTGVLLSAISVGGSLKHAAAVVGLTEGEYLRAVSKYNIKSYFKEEIFKYLKPEDIGRKIYETRKEIARLKKEKQRELDGDKNIQ